MGLELAEDLGGGAAEAERRPVGVVVEGERAGLVDERAAGLAAAPGVAEEEVGGADGRGVLLGDVEAELGAVVGEVAGDGERAEDGDRAA